MKRFMRRCLFFFLILQSCCGNSQFLPKENVTEQAEAKIRIEISDSLSGIAFVHLHADEITALSTVREFVQKKKGNLFYLEHVQQRNISFFLNDSIFEVDPNRIFTGAGRRASLDPYSVAADSMVKILADKILSGLHAYKTVIAVHNNTPSNYSIRTYKKGGAFEGEASKIYISKKMDEDDFIFTTNENIFNKCKKKRLNVVLQDNLRRTDDGSLSVYCSDTDLSYVNIETEFGHSSQQLKMMEFIYEITHD